MQKKQLKAVKLKHGRDITDTEWFEHTGQLPMLPGSPSGGHKAAVRATYPPLAVGNPTAVPEEPPVSEDENIIEEDTEDDYDDDGFEDDG